MKLHHLLIVILAIFWGCKEDEKDEIAPAPANTGDLSVNVVLLDPLGEEQRIAGADVYTFPLSEQGTTDEFGNIVLYNINGGSYEVFANYNNIGTGKAVANVKAGELTETTVTVIPGVFAGLAPEIVLTAPLPPYVFAFEEEITFSATVVDEKTPATELKIVWESNMDGILNEDAPDSLGMVSFSTDALSRGYHEITVAAEDEDGYRSTMTIELTTLAPERVTLMEPTKNAGVVSLEWTPYEGDDFVSYQILRMGGNCDSFGMAEVALIDDPLITNTDDVLVPFEPSVCYFVRVTNTEGFSRDSNIETVEKPSGEVFDFIPYDFLVHPTQSYVYLIDRDNQRMIQYDYTNQEIVNEINLPSQPGYSDIGDNGFGMEIYVPLSTGTVHIYNALTLETEQVIQTNSSAAHCVVQNGEGLLVVSVEGWGSPIRTFSRETGVYIDGGGDRDNSRLRKIPGKDEYISVTLGIFPRDMDFNEISSSGEFLGYSNDSYHGDHPLDGRNIKISRDGEYIVSSSSGAVYQANSSMLYMGQMNTNAYEFSDFAFSDDSQTIYAGTANTNSVQIVNYSTLSITDERFTKASPRFIERKGNQIISFSSFNDPWDWTVRGGIEVIGL